MRKIIFTLISFSDLKITLKEKDIEVLSTELGISKEESYNLLVRHGGDLNKAIIHYLNIFY